MIKDLTFGGMYNDKQLQIEAMLVTPNTHGREDNILLFEVSISTISLNKPQSNEYTFYIMDDQTHNIYNATDVTELSIDGKPTMTVLIAYNFHPEYLYNDIKLGFFYKPYNRIEFIEITH